MRSFKYLNYTFQSSTAKTPEFLDFVRCVRSNMTALLKGSEWGVHKLTAGHFYFSCGDVRIPGDNWARGLLVRTAEHDKDWTGGQNRFTPLGKLKETLDSFYKA